jgi:hypothetical protein
LRLRGWWSRWTNLKHQDLKKDEFLNVYESVFIECRNAREELILTIKSAGLEQISHCFGENSYLKAKDQ